MIEFYTGTPGSGKSLHASREIVSWLRRGQTVICNFPVKQCLKGMNKGIVIYKDNSQITVKYLIEYAMANHIEGKEGQTLVVFDECQIKFNCREFGRADRNEWVTFFSMHRHLGYNIILITQNDRLIDKQIRAMVEYEHKHRKLNGNGFVGVLLMFTGLKWFIDIESWYGVKMVLGRSMFVYRKKYGKIYDSYRKFTELIGDAGAGRDPLAGGDRGKASPQKTPVKAEYEKVITVAHGFVCEPPPCSTGVQFVKKENSGKYQASEV